MICCLLSVCVSRIDWMISLIFRSTFLFGSATSAGSSRRARTSCWVMVEAPRWVPVRVSRTAARMPSGSKPLLVQKVLSSIVVVASMTMPGTWSNWTTSRCWLPNRASSTPLRS